SKANQFVISASVKLAESPSTDQQWAAIKQFWSNANIFLDRIAAIKPDDIRATIQDDTDREQLLGFLDNLAVSRSDATTALNAKDANMKEPVQRIVEALDGLRLKGSVRFTRLTDELASVPNVFAPILAPPPPISAPPPNPEASGDDIQKMVKER